MLKLIRAAAARRNVVIQLNGFNEQDCSMAEAMYTDEWCHAPIY